MWKATLWSLFLLCHFKFFFLRNSFLYLDGLYLPACLVWRWIECCDYRSTCSSYNIAKCKPCLATLSHYSIELHFFFIISLNVCILHLIRMFGKPLCVSPHNPMEDKDYKTTYCYCLLYDYDFWKNKKKQTNMNIVILCVHILKK